MIFTGERLDVQDIGGINEFRYRAAARLVKNKIVMEQGCAFGYGSYYLANHGAKKVNAFDADRTAINYAKEHFSHPAVTYSTKRVEEMGEKDEKYDIVIAFELIEHLQKPETLISLANKVLKKGGKLIISTPNRYQSSYDGDKPSNPFHVKEYYPEELEDLLRKVFTKVEMYGIVVKGKKKQEEKAVQTSLKWKIASALVRKRWIRRLVNYFPAGPKRLITGERKLHFTADDFELQNKNINSAPYIYSICTK